MSTDAGQFVPGQMAQAPPAPASSSVPPVSEGRPPLSSEIHRWRELLAPYARPNTRRAVICLATSVVPYLLLSALMWRLLSVSDLLVLALSIPASVFLVRTFIVFHDCSHGSFLHDRRANAWLGDRSRSAAATRPSCVGGTIMRFTTPPRAISTAAGWGIFPPSPFASTGRCRGEDDSATGCCATHS